MSDRNPLSLIYETSMEKRKALMDARIKKGSALTPEEAKAIMDKPERSGFFKGLSYGWVCNVSPAYVFGTRYGGYIDLTNTEAKQSHKSGTIETGDKSHNIPQFMNEVFIPTIADMALWEADRLLKSEQAYCTCSEKMWPGDKFIWSGSRGNIHHENDPKAEQIDVTVPLEEPPPLIYFKGLLDRSSRFTDKHTGVYIGFMGVAYYKSLKNTKNENEAQKEYWYNTDRSDSKEGMQKALSNHSSPSLANLDWDAPYAQDSAWRQFVYICGDLIP